MITAETIKHMKPLKEANAYLDDPEKLKAMWLEDGYLFLRDVFDKHAIGKAKKGFLDALKGYGVIDQDATEPVWNGKDLSDFPFKIQALIDSTVSEDLSAHPKTKDIAARVLGEEAFFLPMTEYRVTPPQPKENAEGDVMMYRHQDCLLNAGIPFMVCWTPTSHITAEAGGLVVAEGYHKHGFLHNRDDFPMYKIEVDTIPDDAWRRSDYHPGDALFFSIMVPHSGAKNYSNTFRCSMDIRLMAAKGNRPIIGSIVEASPDFLKVRDGNGQVQVLRIDDKSMIRGSDRTPVPSRAQLKEMLPPGLPVMASHRNGVVRGVRLPR